MIDKNIEIKETNIELKMRKVVSYCRYASPTQSCAGIDFQQSGIQRFADTHDMEIVEHFVDKACSGNDLRRFGLIHMLSKAENNPEWDAVLIDRISNFSRNYEDFVFCEKVLNEQGIELISVKERTLQERIRRAVKNK